MSIFGLTEFSIKTRFQEYPEPISEAPEAMPQAHYDAIAKKGFMCPVGSQTIPGAAHDKSDHDFLVLTKDRIPEVFSELGYDLLSGGRHYEPSEGKFNSWIKDGVNFVATDEEYFAKKFLAANAVAQRLSLIKKADRIALFQAVLYGHIQAEADQ